MTFDDLTHDQHHDLGHLIKSVLAVLPATSGSYDKGLRVRFEQVAEVLTED